MTKYIKKHRYISSDEIGILRESKDCTKHDWYKRFESEGVDPEVYYFIFQNNDGLYIVHALLKEFFEGAIVDSEPLFVCKNRRAWEKLRQWLITNKRCLTINSDFSSSSFKDAPLPRGCKYVTKCCL